MAEWKHCSKRKEKKRKWIIILASLLAGWLLHWAPAPTLLLHTPWAGYVSLSWGFLSSWHTTIELIPLPLPFIFTLTNLSCLYAAHSMVFFFFLLSHPLTDKTVSHTRCHVWSCVVFSTFSDLIPFSTVPLHPTLPTRLVGYYLMDSSTTVYLIVLWTRPASAASALLCRCDALTMDEFSYCIQGK